MAGEGRIAVIGAGISGLTAAYRLQQAGLETSVFEANDYPGGRIQSFRRNGFLFDVGAFIYLGSYLESTDLMKELNLEHQLGKFDAYGAMPRNGKLCYFDLNKPVRTILTTRYLSTKSKLKAIKLVMLLHKYWDDLDYDKIHALAQIDTDTVASYCRRELNEEIYQYLAAPAVRGPFLTNPENTSIGQLLWSLKNFFKPYFYGLDAGMDALPRALAERLPVRLCTPVNRVVDHGKRVEICFQSDGEEVSEFFDACLITTTTDQALAIFPQMTGLQRKFYEDTKYICSVNTHVALSRRPANKASYIMTAAPENPDLCGVIVDHLKANNRVPNGKGMLTAFCRHEWCMDNFETHDEKVLEEVLHFLKPYYGDLSNDVEDFTIGRWRRVVPYLYPGRYKDIEAYQKSINPEARVQFAGDLGPVGGVNAALVSGDKVGRRMAATFGKI